MKIFILLLALFVLNTEGKSQNTLEDSLFKWKSVPKLSTNSYPYRTFNPAQQKLPQLFAEWLQKSYQPWGALDYSQAVAEPNQKDEVQPYCTGLQAAMWRAVWDKSGKQVVRQPHSENSVYILANYLIDAENIPMLTVPGRAVFTRRSSQIEKAFAGSSERRQQFVKKLNLENHPQIGKYILQYFGCDGDGCQPLVAVYLSPKNELPIRQLSREELLLLCEQAIPLEAEKRRQKIRGENRAYGKEAEEKWIKKFDEETLPRWKENIQKLRDQYRNRLSSPAELRNVNGVSISTFETYNDIFASETTKDNTYGVYTYSSDVLNKSKSDPPLWICVSWKPTDANYFPYEREIHRSMITHFNFDYLFAYFFHPESLKGKPYTPLKPEEFRKGPKI